MSLIIRQVHGKTLLKQGGCIPAPSLFYEREVSIPACFDAKINKKFKIGLPNRIFRNTSLHITFVIIQNLPSYSTIYAVLRLPPLICYVHS